MKRYNKNKDCGKRLKGTRKTKKIQFFIIHDYKNLVYLSQLILGVICTRAFQKAVISKVKKPNSMHY